MRPFDGIPVIFALVALGTENLNVFDTMIPGGSTIAFGFKWLDMVQVEVCPFEVGSARRASPSLPLREERRGRYTARAVFAYPSELFRSVTVVSTGVFPVLLLATPAEIFDFLVLAFGAAPEAGAGNVRGRLPD